MQLPRSLFSSPRSQALLFRVLGHAGLAVLALTIPEVGPNRFLLAGVLLAFVSPAAILINRRLDDQTRNWGEAFFDLLVLVTLVHLVPHLWMAALALGLMVAIAPSVSLHPASHWIYLAFGLVLIGGMTFAFVLHDVEGWELPIAAVAVTYPSMLYYTFTQMQRANDLRQRAQLLRGLTDLARTIGHDFNNAMVSIVTNTELAGAKLPEDHPALQDMDEILKGTDRARRLCRQLLSFAGRSVAHRGRIEMAAEVAALANLLQAALPTNVTVDLDCEDPLYVEADVPQLHQVLMGTLLYAGDALRENPGPIRVRLEREDGAGSGQRGEVHVTVRWHGKAEPTESGIFELLRATTGGSWSLSHAKRLLSEDCGHMTISPAGDGTEVRLSWPECDDGPRANRLPSETPATPLRASPGQRNILVIDDDEGVRSVARRLFRKFGFGVITARNADHGIEAFERDHPSIEAVLLDLRMPGRDGWSCLNELRNICSSTRVVICSGFDPVASSPTRARRDPNVAFLQKPFLVEELAAALMLDLETRSRPRNELEKNKTA